MTRRPVPRPFRIANILAGILFAVGALIYGRAWLGMCALASYETPAGADPFAGMARFNHFWELSRIGIRVVLAALGLAVLTALTAWIAGRRAP